MSNPRRTLVAAVPLAFVALLGSVVTASAGLHPNGVRLNGMNWNALTTNALTTNGKPSNALAVNGAASAASANAVASTPWALDALDGVSVEAVILPATGR